MKRVISIAALAALGVLVGAAGCNRPDAASCKKAVENIRRIVGTSDSENGGTDTAAAVRSCRGTATKKSVRCMIAAKSLDDLKKCEGSVAQKLYEKAIKGGAAGKQGGSAGTGKTPAAAKPGSSAAAGKTPAAGKPGSAAGAGKTPAAGQ